MTWKVGSVQYMYYMYTIYVLTSKYIFNRYFHIVKMNLLNNPQKCIY